MSTCFWNRELLSVYNYICELSEQHQDILDTLGSSNY